MRYDLGAGYCRACYRISGEPIKQIVEVLYKQIECVAQDGGFTVKPAVAMAAVKARQRAGDKSHRIATGTPEAVELGHNCSELVTIVYW